MKERIPMKSFPMYGEVYNENYHSKNIMLKKIPSRQQATHSNEIGLNDIINHNLQIQNNLKMSPFSLFCRVAASFNWRRF